MKKEFIQPFLEAFKYVSENFFGEKVLTEKIIREDNFLIDKKVVIAIGVRKDLKGAVIFGFNEEDAEKFAERAMKKNDVLKEEFANKEKWEKAWIDALEEFGNGVVGTAMTLYEQRGFTCEITPPSHIEDLSILDAFGQEESVRFELENSIGKIVGKLKISD